MTRLKLNISLEDLRRASRHALRHATSPGFDNITREACRRNQEPMLHRILRQLRLGRYRPSRLRPAYITTASGKRRILVARLQDRIVARVLLMLLAQVECGLPPSCICRTGVDARDCIRKLASARVNLPWALKTDIKSAFDSVKVANALQALQQRGAPVKLVQAVSAMLKPALPQAPGLPQGHPLSQLLLNCYLASVDVTLRCTSFRCWRYMDDIVVLSRSREEVEDVHKLLQDQLEAKGLRLHPRKTASVPPTRDLYFLGWAISPDGSYGPSPGAVKRLQRELKGLTPLRREQRIRGWEAHYGVSLASARTTTPAPTESPPATPTATALSAPHTECR